MSAPSLAQHDVARGYTSLVGGFYFVYGVLALLMTGRAIGEATGYDLWIFTVSPITGILALGAALIAIPSATRTGPARRFALVAGVGFIAWGIACAVTGDGGDPAFANTTANITLYLVTGLLGVGSAVASRLLEGHPLSADPTEPAGE